MKKLASVMLIAVVLANVSAFDLEEVKSWQLPVDGVPARVTTFEGDRLVSVGGDVYRVDNDGTMRPFTCIATAADQVVIDIDYCCNRFAYVAGYLGAGAELIVTEGHVRRNLTSTLGAGRLPIVRSARWLSETELLIEMYTLNESNDNGKAGLYRLDVKTEGITTLIEAHDLRLISVGGAGETFLLQIIDEETGVETVVLNGSRFSIVEPEFVVRGAAISRSEFVLQGIDGLYTVTTGAEQVVARKLDFWVQNVASMHYDDVTDQLYVLSNPPGSGMLLSALKVRR